MPIDQPSDFPREALRLHHANLPAPTHFSPVPDTPDYQVMSPNPGSATSGLPPVPPFPMHLRRVEMSEVTVAPELLQQLAHLANAASEPMMVDEGVEMSAAIREIASQVKGRTEILAGAVQGVATSTQGLSDRVKMLEQQLTESMQREHALAERLQVYFKSQEDRQKGLEHTLDRMGTAMASMQQAMTVMQASLDEHRTSMKNMAVSAQSAEKRFSTLDDQHQAAMARMNYLDHRILQTADSQQGQVETGYLSPTGKTAQPEHFLLTPSKDEQWQNDDDDDKAWWECEDPAGFKPPGLATTQQRMPTEPARVPAALIPQTVDDGVDYKKDGVWKPLKDVPKLEIAPGESWERALQLSVWKAEFLAIAHAVGQRWALFLQERFQQAECVYEQRQMGKLSTYEYLDEGMGSASTCAGLLLSDFESRFCIVLMRTLPEEVKRPVLEYSTRAKVTSQKLLVSLLEVLNPGGKEEVKSLQLWVRSSQTFDEAFNVLRRWQLAVSRLSTLGLPPLSPHEKLSAMDGILQKLERKSEALRFKLQALRMAPEIRRPQDAAVQRMLAQVEEEVRILQADERTKFNRQGTLETVFRAEAKAAARPAAPGFCQFFARGNCKKGDQCAFSHLSPCRFFVLGSCKHGGACKYPHVTPAKAAPKPKFVPKALPKRSSETKPKQGAESKPKAAAAENASDSQSRASSVRSLVMAATTQSSVCKVSDEEKPLVLIDSGANEVIRPYRPELQKRLKNMSSTQVALANGQAVSAHRTSEGELVLPASGQSCAEWIVPLERLTVGLDCKFFWDGKSESPVLQVPQENGQIREVKVLVKNRLPYLSWTDFQPLRRRLAKLWKGKPASCQAATLHEPRAEHPGPLPSSSTSEQRASGPTASPGRGPVVCSSDGVSVSSTEISDLEEMHAFGKKLLALGFPVPETSVQEEDVSSRQCSSCKAAVSPAVIDLDEGTDLEDETLPDDVPTPEQEAMRQLRTRCEQGLYDKQCETCLKSKGYRRPHRRLAAESISNGVLSMDLSGPHPVSVDGHRYMLVTALRLSNGTVLPFLRTLPNKESSTVLQALLSIMAQISSMTGGVAVYFRVHSDCGGEFTANKVVEQIHALGLWKTTTAAHSPEANGVAERMVQKVKDDATRCLLHGGLSLVFWPFAAKHGVFVARQRALGLPIPTALPKVGQKVLVRKVAADNFTSRLDEAVFLCEDETIRNGALVLMKRPSGERGQIVKTRMPLVAPTAAQTWRLESKDGQRVWVSNTGELCWDEPADGQPQLTFEERTAGPDLSAGDVLELVKKQMGNTEPSWSDFCKFGHGYLLSLDHGEPKFACKAVKATGSSSHVSHQDQKIRYHVLSFDLEEDMNQTEAQSRDLVASAEAVSQSVLWSDDTSEEERSKWINGLQAELDNMMEKHVLREVTREEAKDVWGLTSTSELPIPVPSKLVLTRKPVMDSAPSEASASAASAAAHSSWKAKVRLVACGNYQADTQAHMLENSSANPSQEIVRLLISMLARHPEWVALVLDIACAFLNAELGDEKVLIRPPPVLVRLGLIAPHVLWLALRAIYGLRKAPKLWEEERNRMLDHRVVNTSIGNVVMQPLESGAWLLQANGECVGLFMMYVDDGLLVGPREVLVFVGAELKTLWDLKCQGFLASHALGAESVVQVGDENVPVQPELNFLGVKIRRCPDNGVLLHQTPWLTQELNKRGWLHMKGSPSLPAVPEGTLEPMTRDQQYTEVLKKAQSEVGCLQWLALRSRPDIAATVGSVACLSAIHPGVALKLCQGIWRYLSSTRNHGVFFAPGSPESCFADSLWLYGDASLAPGASRSRTGVVIKWGDHVLSWKSQRQALTAWSAFEAEVDAGASACQVGVPVKILLQKVLGQPIQTFLGSDNAACVANLVKGSNTTIPTRTRHFGMRCAYIRDQAHAEGFAIQHIPGTEIPSDALTKVLQRCKLEESRQKLNVLAKI